MTSNECEFLSIRRLPSLGDDYYKNDGQVHEDRVRERTCSVVRRFTTGSSPSLSSTDKQVQNNPRVTASTFIYDENNVSELSYTSVDDIRAIRNDECLWIDVPGVSDEWFCFRGEWSIFCLEVGDKNLLSSLSQRFKIHPLVVLDIQTAEQRTKLDVFEDAFFLVVKLIYTHPVTKKTQIEQISFYLKENILITFQERSKDIFDQVKSQCTID